MLRDDKRLLADLDHLLLADIGQSLVNWTQDLDVKVVKSLFYQDAGLGTVAKETTDEMCYISWLLRKMWNEQLRKMLMQLRMAVSSELSSPAFVKGKRNVIKKDQVAILGITNFLNEKVEIAPTKYARPTTKAKL